VKVANSALKVNYSCVGRLEGDSTCAGTKAPQALDLNTQVGARLKTSTYSRPYKTVSKPPDPCADGLSWRRGAC